MCNVTFRRVRATVAAVEEQEVLHSVSVCIRSLRYPACDAPYCPLCPAPLYNTFPHYRINGTFSKKLLNTKCVF
jgi:hypothetical protein